MCAQQYGLDNLTVIVDRNKIQQGDFTENTIRMEPLADRWAAFGFAVTELDGHDHLALLNAFGSAPHEVGKPSCIIAKTIKGKVFPLRKENLPGIMAFPRENSWSWLEKSSARRWSGEPNYDRKERIDQASAF